jgi:antitoxin component YwqK of YwqJK toxin-antitoxin module
MYLKHILIFLLFCVFHDASAQKYEIFKKDTINYEDSTGNKRGYWKVYNRMLYLPDYTDDQLVEEGSYVNNKKEGIWKQYFNNGKLKSIINYNANIPNGHVKFFYSNGNPLEEGNWIFGRWEGEYKYYYENGKLSYDWKFVNGKRDGIQLYYNETGELKYKGVWKNGLESPNSNPK